MYNSFYDDFSFDFSTRVAFYLLDRNNLNCFGITEIC